MNKIKQKDFETFLNQNSPEQGSDNWIIGGTIRMADMWRNTYGSALRKHDPIAFNVGFKEYQRKLNTKM